MLIKNSAILIKLIKTEILKLRRTPVWLAFIIMPIVPAVLGTVNYLANLSILKSEWYSLWTQHTIFASYFFIPIMIGIYSSYTMRMEYKNNNWNKLLTMPVPRFAVYAAKLAVTSFMILISEIWICLLFIVSGKIAGITSPIPFGNITVWCLFGALGGIAMASIQLVISLFTKSFAVPVGIAFGGGFSGLVFLAKGFGHLWPYSLLAYGMNSNAPQQIIASGYLQFILICFVYIIIMTICGSLVLSKRDH